MIYKSGALTSSDLQLLFILWHLPQICAKRIQLFFDDSQYLVSNYTALNNIIILHDKLLLMDYTEILSQYLLGGTEEMPKTGRMTVNSEPRTSICGLFQGTAPAFFWMKGTQEWPICVSDSCKVLYILESNPHPFYSFRGLKNHMRIRITCRLDSRSWVGFWKNDRAAVHAVRTIQSNNLLFYLLFIILYNIM